MMERELLIALMQTEVESFFNEIGRRMGPALKTAGLSKTAARNTMLDCLTVAFERQSAAYKERWAKERADND
jgi:hypothetical protein